ncbi:hypothetical protein BDV06DRAFT_57217 [Aspergillus oleicola]
MSQAASEPSRGNHPFNSPYYYLFHFSFSRGNIEYSIHRNKAPVKSDGHHRLARDIRVALREPTIFAACHWSYWKGFRSFEIIIIISSKQDHSRFKAAHAPRPTRSTKTQVCCPGPDFRVPPDHQLYPFPFKPRRAGQAKGRSVPEVDRRKKADRLRYDSLAYTESRTLRA